MNIKSLVLSFEHYDSLKKMVMENPKITFAVNKIGIIDELCTPLCQY